MCILLGYDILAARRSDPKPIVFVILDVYIKLSHGGVGVGSCLRGLWRIDIAGRFLGYHSPAIEGFPIPTRSGTDFE
jgi:hypothetical protein